MPHLLLSHLSAIIGFAMATLLIATIVGQRRAPGTTFAWLLAIVLIPYVGVPYVDVLDLDLALLPLIGR